MIIITNLNNRCYKLEQEFQKLAVIVPTIPKDRCLSELEFIEFVIAYIRQLQQVLSCDQQNEHTSKLTSSIKGSILFLPLLSSHSRKQAIFLTSRMQTNESSSKICCSPLVSIDADNST
ncbi:unnamed protein product [Rotaria magnacalcarata]|uniref:BHLH domain-containing protein n=1 Tax=Rotaria magnacalcarata TaxID=392030 RepID=A0A818XCX1_9BILA|nr:unnamed protein product [Rotaria magnacalcarata]CAF1315843.1 unnamed protein product [Rotaria magnacalcarata]CAF2080767.1 unnamed protein product [Rotaria magnacalcarata]CAF2091267.1 unnamed protein product [Rotaria magnacalcarata]CAF2122453.1 unnamed protein product [Rotaria magnacalcarata]